MQTCWFIVIEVKGEWFVDCEGKTYGPFPNKDEAIIDGTRLARTFGETDRQSQLWVKDEAGSRPRRVWEGPLPARKRSAPLSPASAAKGSPSASRALPPR